MVFRIYFHPPAECDLSAVMNITLNHPKKYQPILVEKYLGITYVILGKFHKNDDTDEIMVNLKIMHLSGVGNFKIESAKVINHSKDKMFIQTILSFGVKKEDTPLDNTCKLLEETKIITKAKYRLPFKKELKQIDKICPRWVDGHICNFKILSSVP